MHLLFADGMHCHVCPRQRVPSTFRCKLAAGICRCTVHFTRGEIRCRGQLPRPRVAQPAASDSSGSCGNTEGTFACMRQVVRPRHRLVMLVVAKCMVSHWECDISK